MDLETRRETNAFAWIQTGFTAAMVFSLAVGLSRLGPLLAILTVAAGGWSILTWIAHFDRRLAELAYKHWLTRPVTIWVHRVEGLPLVFEQTKTQLAVLVQTDQQWAALQDELESAIGGYDAEIAELVKALKDRVVLRAAEHAADGLPPIGAFLLLGQEALGKRSLARRLGGAIYGPAFVFTVGCEETAEVLLNTLAQLIRDHANGIVILENFGKAPDAFRDRFLFILRGESAGARSGIAAGAFRNWIFFCICHVDAAPYAASLARADSAAPAVLAGVTGLKPALLAQFRARIPFLLPDARAVARIIGRMFDDACKQRGLKLRRISEDVIIEEYAVARDDGCFLEVHGRVQQKAEAAILDALSRKVNFVDIT